jgi:hypothetical protein
LGVKNELFSDSKFHKKDHRNETYLQTILKPSVPL